MAEISLFDAIRTQRATRRFSTTPVPEEAITTILRAAVKAPSGGNSQPWYFLVIRDREVKRRLGEWYIQAWEAIVAEMSAERAASDSYRGGGDLGRQMQDVPVVIVVCLRAVERRPPMISGGSIYPAVQNLMLAARALGLGTVLTTNHTRFETEIKAYLGIPDDVSTAAMIPLGYPAEGERFGGSRRRPVEEVTFYDRWGNARPQARGG